MKKILAIALILTLSGCSAGPTAQTLAVVSSAADLTYHYESGHVVDFIGNAELSDLEITVVLEALDQVDRSKARINAMLDDPGQFVSGIELVSFEYAKIRSAYLSVRQVVLSNLGEYSPHELKAFDEFDTAARHLDVEFAAVVESIETDIAMQTALRLADTALKIASLL